MEPRQALLRPTRANPGGDAVASTEKARGAVTATLRTTSVDVSLGTTTVTTASAPGSTRVGVSVTCALAAGAPTSVTRMAAMTKRRTLRLSLAAGLVAIVWAPAASAHARLVRTDPAAGEVVSGAPAAVRLTFDDRVQLVGGNDVVRNSDRRSVLSGRARVVAKGKVLVLPLRSPLSGGDFSVRWRVLSDDGHLIGGAFAFGVGAGRPPPRSVLAAPSGSPRAENVVARWLLFTGLLIAAGAAMLGLVVPRRDREPVDPRRRAALLFGGSALFAVGAADLLRGAAVDTRFGTALVAGLVLAGIAAAAALLSTVTRWGLPIAIGAALCLIPIPSVAGHALDAGVAGPNVAFDIAHVAAAAAWVGILTALVVAAPALRAGEDASRRFVARVSTVALVSVVVLLGTGVLRAIFELRHVSQLWTTGYGRAILVKAALLVVLVVIGWANRRSLAEVERVRRNVAVELVVLAGVVVAVAFLTQLRPGRDAPQATAAAVPATSPPPTMTSLPKVRGDALVLARELGTYAVAVAARPRSTELLVLAASGSAADGLNVRVDGRPTESCGHGCYASDAASARSRSLRVQLGRQTAVFDLPARAPSGTAIVRRATRVFRSVRSAGYVERLASSPTQLIVTRWRLEAPNRVAYTIKGGASGIVIGTRRWDRARAGAPWERSTTTLLPEPRPAWGSQIANARVVDETPRAVTVAWANPAIPAWFTTTFDRRTLLPRTLVMTAAAHFMHHRYFEFNEPRRIRPPTP